MTEIVYCRRCKLPITPVNPANPYFADMHQDSAICIRLLSVRLNLALQALRRFEWQNAGQAQGCPWCGANRAEGHAKNCPRQVALGIGTGEMVNYD